MLKALLFCNTSHKYSTLYVDLYKINSNSPAHLNNGCPVVTGGGDHLSGNVRVPGNATAAHLGARVSHLDDGLVLTKVPHHRLAPRARRRHNVLYLHEGLK